MHLENTQLHFTIMDPNIHSFVTCVCEHNWWIGIVRSLNEVEEDFDIKIMHPHGSSASFIGLKKKISALYQQHFFYALLIHLKQPLQLGWSYYIESTSWIEINKEFNIFINLL